MADQPDADLPEESPAETPPGFVHVLRAPFINHVGPLLQAVENAPGEMCLGLRVSLVHTNTMGLMHGGMIATLCDSAMARAPRTPVPVAPGCMVKPSKNGGFAM